MTDLALKARLDALAGTIAPGMTGCAGLERLSGGASQETYALRLEGGGAALELILRRRPDHVAVIEGAPALATEVALIRAAAKEGAPVPEVLRLFAPEEGIGEAYVMSRCEGETLGRRIVRDAAFADVRTGLARRCGEVLAAIHRVGLEGLPPLVESGPEVELSKYEEIYRASGAERPVLEMAFRRLRLKAPRPRPPRLLHGDFRNGNLMVHPQRGLEAVLDWELGRLGPPASDLGWLCVNSWRFGASEHPVGGFGAYSDLLAGYQAAGGEPVDLEEVLYWQALGSLKWGVMCLSMFLTFASGADPSVERAMIGRRVSETEIDLVNMMQEGLI